jgi:uncharacterized phosphosugar-binding protein
LLIDRPTRAKEPIVAVINSYLREVGSQLQRVLDTQEEAIAAAAVICADTIARDRLVFTFGTGHGGFAALETFPRTGSVTGFRPIVESSLALMHHVWGDAGTRQYRFLHTREGLGRVILESHRVLEGDSLLLFSHSGINATILDMALDFAERGQKVIGVTSIPHSSQTPSRHSSGRRLYEVADVVIDTGVPLGDATQHVEGLEFAVGATSTSIAVAIAHAISCGTIEAMIARGLTPHVMVNTNTAGVERAHEHNDGNYEELWRLLRMR